MCEVKTTVRTCKDCNEQSQVGRRRIVWCKKARDNRAPCADVDAKEAEIIHATGTCKDCLPKEPDSQTGRVVAQYAGMDQMVSEWDSNSEVKREDPLPDQESGEIPPWDQQTGQRLR